jgi:hypothetical protein
MNFPPHTREIWQNDLKYRHFRNRQPAEVGLMIDEINYFPERDNYQKKKKVDEDWKELKKQKIFHDSKKKNKPEVSRKPKPPPKEK